MKTARLVAAALVALSAAPAFADSTVTHTDQLVVVTPNPPVLITNGGAPGAAGPSAVAPAAATPAPSNGAPQNEEWEDVSHINGSLVKVGERSDYILRYRKTNIASNPIGWMLGYLRPVGQPRACSPNVAVRLDANIINVDNSTGLRARREPPDLLPPRLLRPVPRARPHHARRAGELRRELRLQLRLR